MQNDLKKTTAAGNIMYVEKCGRLINLNQT